jgi:hypothetical protein
MRRFLLLLAVLLSLPTAAHPFMQEAGIGGLQGEISVLPVGERIARWAEEFLGTPYDTDPMGEYVRRKVVVADERVDCMYHTFRSVELALARTPEEAAALALQKRFHARGVLRDGVVMNYDERFQYASDMLRSGKWGDEVTASLAPVATVEGSRGMTGGSMVSVGLIPRALPYLKSGDIVFFVKDPARRVVGEIVGHIGIIKREGDKVYLIHASGSKRPRHMPPRGKPGGGNVKKILFLDYAASMPFVGIKVGRFR